MSWWASIIFHNWCWSVMANLQHSRANRGQYTSLVECHWRRIERSDHSEVFWKGFWDGFWTEFAVTFSQHTLITQCWRHTKWKHKWGVIHYCRLNSMSYQLPVSDWSQFQELVWYCEFRWDEDTLRPVFGFYPRFISFICFFLLGGGGYEHCLQLCTGGA